MAGMNKTERATQYLRRLRTASNKRLEAEKIANEIESLVWSATQKRLSKQEKIEIIEELNRLAQLPHSPFRTRDHEIKSYNDRLGESFEKGLPPNITRQDTTASDNSGILDVISMLKRGVKD